MPDIRAWAGIGTGPGTRDGTAMGISPTFIRDSVVMTALVGGGAFALTRFSPIDNEISHGFPKGGPIEAKDWKLAAGIGAAGLVMGAPMGLVGAAIADAPRSMLGSAMGMGALVGAAMGVGAVLGNAARD